MKKIFSFTKRKKHPSGTPDNGSVLSVGYELKEKDLGKVHKAASVGDLAKLKQLVKKNDINQLDKENRTALHIACASGHVEVVQFLVESKAKLNLCDNQNRSSLMKAVQGQHERCVSILLENHAEPNLVDVNGNTALHLAVNIPSIFTTVLLLEHEADINAQNKDGFTPLIVSVREDHIEMAEFLLKESAGLNLMDQTQRSPLMIAAGNGQISMLRLLLRFDADITLKDTKGWSADDYAVMNGHHPCSLLIIEHSTRNDGPSLSNQDPGKKKKKSLLGSPSQDVEAGFSLGGPATDKDEHGTNEAGGDFEDNSQSESLSRVSKSAADEWVSSEDDDESILIEKKPQKVNLRQMIASKRGEDEQEEGPDLEQPSSSKAGSDSQEGSPEAEDSEEEEDDEDEEEDEEEEDDEDEEEEDDDDDESEEEDEDKEENECDEEDDEECVASVEANPNEFKDRENPSITGTLTVIDDDDDAQNSPGADIAPGSETSPGAVGQSLDAKAETKQKDAVCPAGTASYAMPATLDVEGDCVVSAIRVESTFSDEDDSHGKECARSADPRSAGGPRTSKHGTQVGNDADGSWSDEANGGGAGCEDGADEEERPTGGLGRRALPANQRNVDDTDGSSDAGSNKEAFKGDHRRSSWGSSLEGGDDELPKEEEGSGETLDPKSDVPSSPLKPEAALHSKCSLPQPNKDHLDTSWDSPSPPRPARDEPLPSLGLCSTSTPQSENRPAKATVDESGWDSSENDNGSFTKGDVQSPVSKTNIVTPNQTGERQRSDGSGEEEDKESVAKESNNPFPAASLVAGDKKTTIGQTRDNDDVESVGRSPQMDVKCENEEGDDSRWGDDDESDESEKQKVMEGKGDEVAVLKASLSTSTKWKPTIAIDRKSEGDEDDEKAPQSIIDGEVNVLEEEMPAGDQRDAPRPRASSQDLDEQPIREAIPSSPAPKDGLAAATSSREALPQTDIDDVDLDSPDEAESVGVKSRELVNVDEPVVQKEDSTGDEDVNDQEEEEDDEDVSDENDEPEESGESLDATPPVPETEVSKDKKRDFLSELGLEKGDEEQDSWDSESHSENPDMPRAEKQSLHTRDQEQRNSAEQQIKENVFYVPSFLRGEGDDRMAVLEPRRSVGRPRGSQGEVEINNDDNGAAQVEKGGSLPKETEKAKWKPLHVVSKLEGDGQRKTDLMEEFGLGDVDDLEDPSDWDSASTASRRTLPGRRMPSPGIEEFPECSNPPVEEQDEDIAPAAAPTPPMSINSDGTLPSTPLQPVPQPQPRTRKMALQKPESEEESDWEPDNVVSSHNKAKIDNRLQNIAALQTAVTPGSTELSPMAKDGTSRRVESEEQQQKEVDDAIDPRALDLNNPCPSGHVSSDGREKEADFRDQRRPGERSEAGDGVPWENRYEKLWVEVEKRDVKSTFKSVAGELKEKFGELRAPRHSAEDVAEEEERATAESTSAEEEGEEEEESSDEDEGEVIVRPMARARSTGLLTIPEQKESGPEDSATESTDDSSRERPARDPHLDPIRRNSASSEEDPEEVAKSRPPSRGRRSASVPCVSDEEDAGRLKLEVGKETTEIASEAQKSITSGDTGGMALEKAGTEKPETRFGSTHQEQPSAATESINGAAVEETSQLELVRGARRSRAPQTNTHVNGDPLSVFDDSTLSELSDDEGSERHNNKNLGDAGMPGDFDELSQSSDTGTDDIDSPTSGYRHASLLIQKLDSVTFDSRSMVKLQNIFHEYERCIQKARSRHGYLADKVRQLETERAELKSSLEEVKEVKSALERNQLELQTEVTNLKFQLKQEQENRRNATMMYNTTRDKLRRMEEQQQLEVQERQKVELSLRNLELEMRTLVNNMKQLEEDHSETQRLLAQERSARTLQENLLSSHLRKQQEIEADNKRNISKSNEALSQLTEASDRERELLQQSASFQDQLTILRTDLERAHATSSLKESHLLDENEALKEQLEDARRDLKLNGEALTQTVFNCNGQLTALKSESTVATSRLENERQARETLDAEVESTRIRLAGAVKEAELCMAARADAEKALLREKEEHRRLQDKLTGDAASQREAVSGLSQKLAKAESRANSMENEVHRATLQLTEKSLLLDVLQREKEQAAALTKELESALRVEREQISRVGARQEATQERLAQTQSDGMLLRQQLEEAQNKGVAKEHAVTDAHERFSDIVSKLRSDSDERVQLVEERTKEIATKAADLRDQIYKLEEEKAERETSLRQLQQELADALKKLSMSEASLEVNTRHRNDLEDEKARLFKDLDRIKGKLEESEDQYVQAEKRFHSLKGVLEDKEKELATAARKHQEALSASAASGTVVKQLEEAVQQLEIENARLDAAAKQQSNKIEALQKGAQEFAMLSDCAAGEGVRGHLENLVTNLQSSKMSLEDQLTHEVQKQSMLSHTAQDSQALWEEELKSRSKLGLRLAELDKEKEDLSTQMVIEKKKAKKIAEQKKAVDTRLDQEMNRNTELQKEMYRLRTLLKTAKKKLRDQDVGGAEFVSPMSSLRMEQGRHGQAEGSFGRMKEKVDDLQVELEKAGSRRSQLEKANGDLKDQLASMRSSSCSSDQLERSKRQLEEEVLDLRRRMEASQTEQGHAEQYRRDAEERARYEVKQKLEQVNVFLQSQAASQEALDQIKAANESSLRSQLEQKIRELEMELCRARTTHHDGLHQRDSTRTEMERYRQLYTEELRHRKSLAAKLERANGRLGEANSKLLNERGKSLIAGGIASGSLGGPSLDVGSLGSPAHYGATLGPLNRSLGLGLSLLSPVTEGQNSRVEDYLAKMQSELDRNISKELNSATAELDVTSARVSPVGSASRVELDPVSRATQQYLEVLKMNSMI
ncbi:ankyrin repeat domain-containing protein 26 isoform X4 [Pseudoliparis swirei]|uniref:ankyrin repeat domain-containing protein 26 isoform X4 n=1 Tax=Pseudoliparis swirei TaxID=2059687 RepID=UPI0024BE4DFC|nr:ankyrin repeat domain-containing protein 26 isoform X4 [Pseudoliparis swirei]